MRFNTHSAIEGKHAFLSPSVYNWINYTDEKLRHRWTAAQAAARGTSLHDLAHEAIRLGVRLSTKNKLLSTYVDDGIGYKMTPEQPLYFSDNCFGTPDTICYRRRMLRIHDLKTGITKASQYQLYVYAAIFCLEYEISPFDIKMELRIYQNDEIRKFIPEPEEIAGIMQTIIDFDQQIEQFKEGDLW